MTEMDQSTQGPLVYQALHSGDSTQGLGQHSGFIGGMLIIAGAVISLFMALTGVRRPGLWMLPTSLFVTGVILAAKPLEEN